jgi:Histidinol dehydrogenase
MNVSLPLAGTIYRLITFSLLLSPLLAFCHQSCTQKRPSFLHLPTSDPSLTTTSLHSTTTTTTTSTNMTPVTGGILNRLSPSEVSLEIKDPVDPQALEQAKAIMNELLQTDNKSVDGEKLLAVAQRLRDVDPEQATSVADLIVSKEACQKAFEELSETDRAALVNIHGRIQAFAEMQRKSVVDMEMDIPGGKAGHTVSPCQGS